MTRTPQPISSRCAGKVRPLGRRLHTVTIGIMFCVFGALCKNRDSRQHEVSFVPTMSSRFFELRAGGKIILRIWSFDRCFLQLDQIQLALPSRDYYLKESSEAQLNAYHRYMTNVAVLLGANPETAAEEFNHVINLEKQLANVRAYRYTRRVW